MSTRLTLFTATLVQDSALSVSGVDRESSADQPFAIVDNLPILAGRGLKGAAVAMARRFFDPLPRSISEDADKGSAYRRSAWEFANTTPDPSVTTPRLRAGVGIRHKTGARAKGVLYDREVVPANTRWPFVFRVDWSLAGVEAAEAEGILGYVLARHWSEGRCWLGGGAARGLGWCHIDDLRAYRFDSDAYDRWIESGRTVLPTEPCDVPVATPTRSWCFRTLDLRLSFGECRPSVDQPAWGLDMLAIGPHDSERSMQVTGDGAWARPSWTPASEPTPDTLSTDLALLMDGDRPLLPGSSVRGPLRHAFSRAKTAAGGTVQDPHLVQGKVEDDDEGGRMFGTVAKSSRVLVRDGSSESEWAAARLHMHAEDEFSAGSYGSAKRDAVRVLRGVFPIRIVVEGPEASVVEPLVTEIDRLVALGEIGHLPVGGHKTRGAGWGRWQADSWTVDDVNAARRWEPSEDAATTSRSTASRSGEGSFTAWTKRCGDQGETARVRVTPGHLDWSSLTLGGTAAPARAALGENSLVAWWCDPTIDLALVEPPVTFGRRWPDGEDLHVDEVAFYADRAVWRAARTVAGLRWVLVEEVGFDGPGVRSANVVRTPARLHGFARFSAAPTDRGRLLCLREWHIDGRILGFTLERETG